MINPVYTKGEGENAVKKPLHECTVEECYELKTTIFDKYQKLMSIGKSANAMQFLRMMQQVDERIMNLQIELAKQEAEKLTAKKDIARAKPSTGPRKTGSDRNRWTTAASNID